VLFRKKGNNVSFVPAALLPQCSEHAELIGQRADFNVKKRCPGRIASVQSVKSGLILTSVDFHH